MLEKSQFKSLRENLLTKLVEIHEVVILLRVNSLACKVIYH